MIASGANGLWPHGRDTPSMKFRIVWVFCLVSLVPLGIFIIDLNAGLWHVLLTSAGDVKLGGAALEHRSRAGKDLGKLEKWFGK